MYWIYLAIFVGAIFVPHLVNSSWWFLTEEQSESVTIVLLGAVGFMTYHAANMRYVKTAKERAQIQREATRSARDLSSTYSYIGELNRKVEILRDAVMSLPQKIGGKEANGNGDNVYASLLDAVHQIAGTRRFVVRFIDRKTGKTRREIRAEKSVPCPLSNKDIPFDGQKTIVKVKSYTIFFSPPMDVSVCSCIIFTDLANDTQDNNQFLSALASQALLLHLFSQKDLLCFPEEKK